MGSHMKKSIFEEQTAKALKKWHQAAKQRKKLRKVRVGTEMSNGGFMSGETTPSQGSSPLHLLHKYRSNAPDNDSLPLSPSTYSSMAAERFLTLLERDEAPIEKPSTQSKPSWIQACKLLDVEQNPSIVLDVIDEYRAEGFVVSVKIFKVVLNLCRAANDANLALRVLRKMKEFNCRPDTVSYNVVIQLLVESGQLDEAMGLMREMGLIDLYPDMITYVSIIKGFCDAGRLEEACGLIKVMKGHGCVPNAVVYSAILDGICRHGSLEMASEFLGGMEKENGACVSNLVTYTTMIKGFVEKGMAMEALRVFNRMDDFGVKPNKVTFTAMLDGLCKEGHVEEACKIIDKFSGGGIQYDELYSLLVMSLVRAGKHKDSEKMFRMMMARGMRPNGLASSSIIKRMISEGRVLDGFLLFDALEKSGNLLAIDSEVYSILLAELCQENHFIEAAKLVNVMVEGRIRLKSPHAENIIKHLNISGEYDLASDVSRIKKSGYSNDGSEVSVVKDEIIAENSDELKQTLIGKPPRHLSVVRHSISTTTLVPPSELDSCTGVTGVNFPLDLISSYVPVFRSGSCAEKGPKLYMEDEHICIDNLPLHLGDIAGFPSPGAFYGVFDGHGGTDAASFVRSNILKFIVENSFFPTCVEKAIKSAYLKADYVFADDSSLDISSGTTALTAFISGR
ncbi:hypothetical protein DH2020_035646 [Rehmannia glutinosa]|uniref:protein-serine/threonine phosphatase n=1 Tax=Rehmannia glutinosa TaxID=99300 RepID=A0ABR0V9F1_REHGL